MYKGRIREEYNKLAHKRKKSAIDTAMEKTFAKRREEIVLQRLAVPELCDVYPAFKDAVEVSSIKYVVFL